MSALNFSGFSISTAAYDGYPYPEIFQSVKSLGARYVEIALIAGYVAEFGEKDLTESFAASICSELEKCQLACSSFACHVSLDCDEAGILLLRRLRFARVLGAPRIILNAVGRERFPVFLEQIKEALELAEEFQIQILFENPGDGSDHTINTSEDIPSFLSHFVRFTHWGRNLIGINYDPGNLFSHRPGLDVAADAENALEYAKHLHIKDVALQGSHYHFCPIGQGQINYREIFAAIKRRRPEVFFSIEYPFRLSRDSQARPLRTAKRLTLSAIELGLRKSIHFIQEELC